MTRTEILHRLPRPKSETDWLNIDSDFPHELFKAMPSGETVAEEFLG